MLLVFVVPCEAGIDLKVDRTVLENGLVVLHSERHNLPLVMVNLLVKSGSINEPDEKAGISYLTASMLTEGTSKRSSVQIGEELDFLGASLSASSSLDYSMVSLSVLKSALDKGFELMADCILNPSFSLEELQRKKKLIAAGLKQKEESPEYIADRALYSEIFGKHPYSRPVEGKIETVNAISSEDLSVYHMGIYRPNNSILTVVGDITKEELNALIARYLSGWQSGKVQVAEHPPVEAVDKKAVFIEKDLTQATVLLGQRGVERSSPDYYTLQVLNYILGGGGFSSRMMDSIRDKMGLAYDVSTSYSSFMQSGIFTAGLQTKNSSAGIALEEMKKEIWRIAEEDVKEAELSDAKSFLTGSFPRRLDTTRKISDFIALSEFYGLGLDYIENYIRYINSVSASDIRDAAGRYLKLDGMVLVVVGPRTGIGNIVY